MCNLAVVLVLVLVLKNIFQVLVLVLVLGGQVLVLGGQVQEVLVLVLVLEDQVLVLVLVLGGQVLVSIPEQYYPLRTITLTSRDPPYMTPDTKFLLRGKNRLMRQGRLEEASAIAVKIRRAIARFNSRELSKLNSSSPAGTKKLWQAVKNLTKPDLSPIDPSKISPPC